MKQNTEHENVQRLSINAIKPSRYNPRKYFDEQALNELAQSIQQDDLIQPIVVRPLDNDAYEIVAGERRWRASQIAGLESIPCSIKTMDDKAAIRISAEENLNREDMSPIEESFAAQNALTVSDGDRQAAASVLSWTQSKLNKRLLLLNLCDEARQALMQGDINIGHAELISSLTEINQKNAVTSIKNKNVTVAELKEKLSQFAYRLDTAIFDTNKCNGCQHNTSQQSSLFEENIGAGCCTNPVCYEEKEKTALEYIKHTKQEDYNVCFLDIEKTSDSYNYLLESKVGKTQYKQCQQCANLGALISTRRETIGQVDEGVCFDSDCYKKKTMPPASKKERKSPVADTKQPGAAKTPRPAKADNTPPKKVIEYKTRLIKALVGHDLVTNKKVLEALNIAVLLESLPHMNYGTEIVKQLQADFDLPFKVTGHSVGSRDKTLKKLLELTPAQRAEVRAYCLSVIAATGQNDVDLTQTDKSVDFLVEILKPEYINHFALNDEFLQCQTKTGMIGLLKEAGFDSWLDKQKEKGTFSKLAKGTIKGILAAFNSSNYPVKGFVPKVLQYKGYSPANSDNTQDNINQ